jgi:hypothetical protein
VADARRPIAFRDATRWHRAWLTAATDRYFSDHKRTGLRVLRPRRSPASHLTPARDAVRVTDWLAWHDAYDDPSSSLARRLGVVRRRLGEVLDAPTDERRQLLSLCAGDGRDVIPVLAARASRQSLSALLVERDEALARRARESASSAGLDAVEVRCADAGDPASFDDVLPVDVLLLCGIFGNIEHTHAKDLIDVVPHLLAKRGYVIWTRGGSDPDRRPEVRHWFRDAGLAEISFDGAPEPFGVGLNQLTSAPPATKPQLPSRIFSFVSG